MEPLVYTPTYEIFLVIDAVKRSFAAVQPALAPLDTGEAPPLLGADVYYREHTDIALLALRFDERRIGLRELAWLQELARGAGLPVLDPQRLSDDDRRGFYQSYLAAYQLRLEDFGTVHHALRELGRQLGLAGGRPGSHAEGPKRLPGDTPKPVLSEGEGPSPRLGSPRRLGTPPLDEPPPDPGVPAAELAGDTERLSQPIPIPGPRGKGKEQRVRPETVPGTPLAKAGESEKRVGSEPGVASGSGLLPLVPPDELPPGLAPGIEARYLRGDAWAPARLRALSVRGAYLVTGALPRRGEWVHLALSFRGQTAVVAGIVHHVTTVDDAASTGSTGFSVKFPTEDSAERVQLVALLQQARASGVTLRPPPARIGVRFPVRWPIRLASREGGFAGEALDVSMGGMFVHTGHRLGEEVAFRLPLDTDEAPLHGRARVARRVGADMALSRGLAGGYGLSIVELGDVDEHRWHAFLERVRCRTERRVLVASIADRAGALRDALAAAGYTAAAVHDLDSLLRWADSQPPDA
ncbi:MAG TPA: PilZ domain-containing protein, partial [Kofleriaceae bacterium]|nr:PilZ domain-containing protein [Kofleriaceae bacterium]